MIAHVEFPALLDSRFRGNDGEIAGMTVRLPE